MRRILTAIALMGLGGMLTVGAFGFHIVRSPRGDLIIWKSRPSLKDVYVDVRNWKSDEWKKHPDLTKALREAGRADVVPKPQPLDPLQKLLRKFRGREEKSSHIFQYAP